MISNTKSIGVNITASTPNAIEICLNALICDGYSGRKITIELSKILVLNV